MKKKFLRMVSMVLVVVMLAGLVTGCGGGKEGGESAKGDKEVTVSLMVPTDFEDEIRDASGVFEKSNPNIKVEIQLSAGQRGNTPTELSKLAAGGNLPDVAMGVENFAYILSQGLAYPLDNLYEADPYTC